MSSKNKSIPEFVTDNLLWYESHDLMTYIDKLKGDRFLKNPNEADPYNKC